MRPVAQVVLQDISRRFPGRAAPAVSSFSLTVEPGEFIVLVGPSGCGKSTVLRMLAGLEPCDTGHVFIDGRSMDTVSPQDRDVAMVFQGYALYPHMSVRDIMAFPLKMRGMSRPDRDKAVAKAAEMLSITRLLDRRPAELSGGERQRVAMGRAIVRQPKVFLFDEPLSNLDAALRADLRVEIGSLVRQLGATTLYVTHDHVEAMTLGDRIAVMRDGTLQQLGSPREIYERPANSFVASFLGSPAMNLSEARRDGAQLVAGGIRLRVADNTRLEIPTRLLVGVRPEHVQVGQDLPAHAVAVDAVVTAIEPLGAETHVHLDAGGALLRARMPGFTAPRRGDHVRVSFDPAQVHAFDPQRDGARVDLSLEAA